MVELREHQEEAKNNLSNGKVLYGGVGAGKTHTAFAYYCDRESPKDVYVITTAKKRDSGDWQETGALFCIGPEREPFGHGKLVVDSWNNVSAYVDVKDAFFIFDEQRLVGTGAWVKAFLKIAENNNWILLSATPGDTWLDYAPIFIANGYYKNITDFKMKHVVYEAFAKYPKVRMYLNEAKLELLRNEVLVEMPYESKSKRVMNWLEVGYDEQLFNRVWKKRWHIYEERPLKDISEMFRVMREVVNSDSTRLEMILKLLRCHNKIIIFYNFNYELEILRQLGEYVKCAEWNGMRKDPLPTEHRWVYLVQYVAGAEGWNCIDTNAMVFYSMTYSYKNFEQAQGRIDRLNQVYGVLYYYVLVSNSVIDRGIRQKLQAKQSFNERKFMRDLKLDEEGEW